MTDGNGIDGIICFTGDPWGDVKRPGQLMLQMSERLPVVYVEPHVSLASLVKNWRTVLSADSRARLRRALSRRAEEVAPGIHVVTSAAAIPTHRLVGTLPARVLRTLSDGQHRRAALQGYRAAARLGMSSPMVWITYPIPFTNVPDQRAPMVVYDCMDRWTDFPDALVDAAWRDQVVDAEDRLLDRADLVFCSAAGLYTSKRRTARGPVELVRNGADVGHFMPRDRKVPEDLSALPRPIIGYVGAVAQWVDFELLRAVALSRPEWSIVLVGPIFKGTTMGDPRELRLIADLPNVHLLGPRPYADIPAYLEAFDVATIPFKLNGLTEDTSPIKVYEYLAAGVPVVSTPLLEVTTLPQVHLAATSDEFVVACEVALAERSDPGLVARRIAVAEENSWRSRADAVWGAVLEQRAIGGRRS